jgi:predicted MFS family arabinose efflux permease
VASRVVTAEYPTAELSTAALDPLPGPDGRRRPFRAALMALAVGVAFADSSIVVLALPDLLGDFGTSIESVSWVITAYNLAVAVVALGLIRAVRRLDAVRLTRVGLVVFALASLGCAVADGLAVMVAARTVQGIGAALLLAGSVPLLAALTGSRRHGAALWGAAAVVGAAVGPALGGALTQVYDWPSIFVAQVPLALAAVAATIAVRVPSVPATVPPDPHRRARWASGTALALLSAALVGALFLSVVLIINGWGHPPLLAAGLVSLLPLGALAAGPVAKRSAPQAAVAGGTLLLAAGLVAMALLPEPSLVLISAALSLCGLGIGLSMPALTEASLRGPSHASSGTWSVGARHAGLVVGLVLLAPILAGSLLQVRDRAELAGAAALIDAPLSIEQKVEVGQALDRAIATAPAGEIPDLRAAVATGGDPDDPARVALLDDLDALIAATITRGFRWAFALCAALAVLALLPLAAIRRSELG